MTKQLFDVHIQVEVSSLSTILSALDGAARLVSVTEAKVKPHTPAWYATPAKPTSIPPLRTRKRGAKGHHIHDAVMEYLGSEPRIFDYTDIARMVTSQGWARGSASSVLHKLKTEGKVRFLGDGKYALPGTAAKLGELQAALNKRSQK